MFSFFEEEGRKLFGLRFGRAIEYTLQKDETTGIMKLTFKPGIICSEDEPDLSRLSKETLVCECIAELVSIYNSIYAYFNVYGTTIKFTEKDNFFDIQDRMREAKENYIKQIDLN